jgi:hypothetical protein
MRTLLMGVGFAVALAAFIVADSANAGQMWRPQGGPQFHAGPQFHPGFNPGIRPNFGPGIRPGFGWRRPDGVWVAQPPVYADPPVVVVDPPPVLYQCGVDPNTGQIFYDGTCVPPPIPMDPGSD